MSDDPPWWSDAAPPPPVPPVPPVTPASTVPQQVTPPPLPPSFPPRPPDLPPLPVPPVPPDPPGSDAGQLPAADAPSAGRTRRRRWPFVVAIVGISLTAAAVAAVYTLLTPVFDVHESNSGMPFLIAGVPAAALLLVAWLPARRVRSGNVAAILMIVAVLGAVGAAGSIASAKYGNTYHSFGPILIGETYTSGDVITSTRCQLASEEISITVAVLDDSQRRWRSGQEVPFTTDPYPSPAVDYVHEFDAAYEVDEETEEQTDLAFPAGSYSTDISDAAAAVDPSGVACGFQDYWNDRSLKFSSLPRDGLLAQRVWVASEVCRQALPLIPEPVFAVVPEDCPMELAITEEYVRRHPEYDYYGDD